MKPDFLAQITAQIPDAASREPIFERLEPPPPPGKHLPKTTKKPPRQFTTQGRIRQRISQTDWLVRGFFESDTLTLMFGESGCGKSFLAFDIAACVASGTEWHGRRVKQGAVFVIAGEGGKGVSKRFEAWSITRKVSLEAAPLYISGNASDFTDAASTKRVADEIGEWTQETGVQPVLIVIDTLARNFGGGDENSTPDMNRFVTLIDNHFKARFNACVLIVHHSGHADKGRARGSSALKCAVDAEYGVSKDEAGFIRLEASKMKDAEFPDPLAFKMEKVDLGLVDDIGEPITSCVLNPAAYVDPPQTGRPGRGRNQTAAAQVLRDLENEHRERLTLMGFDPLSARVKEEDWRARLETAPHNVNRKRFHEVRKGLLDAGSIILEPGGYVRSA